ncbi:glutathione S-transferase family protein [Marinobacterium litorale]|uniref:glutathione S-transferase family protein n=1 Tax=Marinobacterium litorale TaxID=404770 RepID=UPI00041F293A|nr:glutathione S-transferase family protein [Marinobacterium litorale]
MKLIGSSTSPYVRRIRLLLADAGQGYEFADLNIYGADRDELRKENPAMKIPVLHDGDDVVYDSRVISRYLQEKLDLPHLSWEQENQLTVIDAVNDSMVTLLLSQRSGLDTDREEVMFYRLQHERIALSLKALEELAATDAFTVWHYPSICLYSMLDWGYFRELIRSGDYPNLARWHAAQDSRSSVTATDPRQAN